MTKYAISPEGTDALRKLAQTLSLSSDEIVESCNRTINEINGLAGELGIYQEHILLLIKKILLLTKISKEGPDGTDALANSIITLANNIEELYGFDSGSGAGGDNSSQPKVLRMPDPDQPKVLKL